MKNIRQNPGHSVYDPSDIAALEFSASAGAKKVAEVGRHLLPVPYINAGVLAYTTDLSTARPLPELGKNIAVYNNAATVATVTLGEDGTVLSLAVGITDADGHVGIPCAPNAWTYIACANSQWVITSAATLKVFIIDDATQVRRETP